MWVGLGCFCLNYCISSGCHEGKHACGIMEAQVALKGLSARLHFDSLFFLICADGRTVATSVLESIDFIVASLLFCLSSSLYSSAVCLFLSPILDPFSTGQKTCIKQLCKRLGLKLPSTDSAPIRLYWERETWLNPLIYMMMLGVVNINIIEISA